MSRLQDDLTRTAMAGVSTGGRTFTALAVLALTARPDTPAGPDRVLAKPGVKGVLGLLALTELVADKLPSTPSRLEVPGLPGRLAAGAACGAVIASRESDPSAGPGDPRLDTPTDPDVLPSDAADTRTRRIFCALAGAASAAAASWAGVHWRSACASWAHRDWIGAGLEDVAVVTLAGGAARTR